jgi:hypothetical protein
MLNHLGSAPALGEDQLLGTATIVIRMAERKGLGAPVVRKKPAQPICDLARSASHRPHDPQVNDLGGESFVPTTQAAHAVPAVVGDPHVDEALRHAEASRGFGAGPPIDKNALNDQRALRRGEEARLSRQMVHVLLTRAAARQFQVD